MRVVSFTYGFVCLITSQNSFAVERNIYGPLILGIMVFHNYVMTIEFASFDPKEDPQDDGFFFFSFQNGIYKLRQFQIISPIHAILGL